MTSRFLRLLEASADDLVCGYHLALIRPNERSLEPRFLFWTLASTLARQWFGTQATGVTRFGLRSQSIADAPLRLPSLAVQRDIADFLDAETARINELIEKRRRIINLVDARLRATRLRVVVGNQVGQASATARHESLGAVREQWAIERLKTLARIESGHTPNRQISEYWENCTIPWVTLNDVGRLEEDETFDGPKNRISELGLAHSSARVLPEGTVILSRDATIGRVALLGKPMAISQHFVGWVCGPRLLPQYLLEVLRGPLQDLFSALSFGSTIPTIGMPELRDLVVPVPPLPEQHAIVDQLRQLRTDVRRSAAVLSKQVDLLLERREALITTAVTGQLDVAKAAA